MTYGQQRKAIKPVRFKLTKKHTYTITEEDIAKCNAFVDAVLPTNTTHWEKLGGNPEVFRANILKSKPTEIAVSTFLNKVTVDGYCSQPDFQVYSASKKSFSPDLYLYLPQSLINLHVKSFPLINDAPFWSWDINPRDPSFSNPQPNDFTALTISDLENNRVYLVDILPNKKIKPLLDYPICTRSMLCFYYEDYLKEYKPALYDEYLERRRIFITTRDV